MDGAATPHRRETTRREFAAFLKSRRDRLDPGSLGLPVVGKRRTPGLRREEVAQLAGVSVDYYTRLEQSRDLRPSATVLNALARALQLSDPERDHLFRLGHYELAKKRPRGPQKVRPGTRRLLELLEPTPAFLLGRSMDVLAWNRTAAALITDFAAIPASRRNIVWLLFLDPAVRGLYPDWQRVARDDVGVLRTIAGRHPDDPAIAALVGELSVKSLEFRNLWSRHDVKEKASGTKRFAHPLVGELTLDYDTYTLGDADQHLVVLTAAANSPAQATIELLATIGVELSPTGNQMECTGTSALERSAGKP